MPADDSRISPEIFALDSGPRQGTPPPQARTTACHLLAVRLGSEAGHLYGGQGTVLDRRSGLWVVEMLSEVALIVAEVALVVAEVALVAAEVVMVGEVTLVVAEVPGSSRSC